MVFIDLGGKKKTEDKVVVRICWKLLGENNKFQLTNSIKKRHLH